ncbi:MAG TPA: TIGR00730 family Rossman fold protein [Kofleriaceae bacterium]|nr:TIGR00730 family Rossman fold protein [Kofleriaceae bacterium]
MRICVYCASSAKIDPAYFDATERLARELVAAGAEIVYGGGSSGLMGRLADTVLDLGGRIKGIMPRFMNEVEWAHRRVTDFELTDTMHERKARFLEGIDGVVALPGGTGTLEELLEAITLKRLGQLTQPIVIVNTRGFYDPLREMLDRCVREQFMHDRHRELWTFVDEPEQVLPAIAGAPSWLTAALALEIATPR